MKKIIIFLCFFCIFVYSKDISNNILITFDIWKNNLVPSLFPFLILSKFVLNYNFSFKFLNNIFSKIFNINPNCFNIFLMSMISGFPSSSKYTKELLDNNVISKEDSEKIILFSHFANPAFIFIVISSNFFNNFNVGYIILFSHYFTNIIIGLMIRDNKYTYKIDNYKFIPKSFGQLLSSSIKESMDTLFLILGSLVTYSIIITLFNKLPINIYYKSIISGFIELTNGLKSISILNLSLKLKASFATMFLSFGGLAIHTQIISILKINYLKFIKYRFIHGLISFGITFILMYLLQM